MISYQRLLVFTSLILFNVLGLVDVAAAHSAGETYVWVNVVEDGIEGRVEINLNDLRDKLGFNVPNENVESFIAAKRDEILTYVRKHLKINANGEELPIEYTHTAVLRLNGEEGHYAQFYYTTPKGPVPDKIEITNSLFVNDDLIHRSLVCVEKNTKSGQEFNSEFVAMVFGRHNPTQELDLTNIELLLRPRDFIWQGVLHIWIGTDHILFIVSLLLPAVLIYQEQQWQPVPGFKAAFWNIIRIVTIFTVAHSITLSLAALGVVDLPSRIVESVIALSIVLVAVNAIRPRFHDKAWLVIFGFGLFHGMGFASVMSDLPFRMVNLVKVLIGFNIGVELGQLAIIAVVFPMIFFLRKFRVYVPGVLKGGSLIIASIACFWFVERAFGL